MKRAGVTSKRIAGLAKVWAGILLILAAVVCLAPGADGVPIRPDLIDSLRAEGRLEEFVESQLPVELDACERGLDAPARPFALLGQGLPVSQSQPRNLRAITILVDFEDNQADTVNFPPSAIERLLFSIGQEPYGSLREYYLENSFGLLDVTGSVTRWYRMPQPYSFYVAGKRGLGPFPMNAQGLALDAIKAADWDVNYSNFDNDGPDGVPDSGDDDGYVDALMIVHAGPGYEATLDTNDIHSHKWVLFFEQTLDGVKLWPYLMQPENGLLGVYCHEFGHNLGLIDLYDRDYRSMGLGGWSLMAYGSWNQLGLRPGHMDAWSKMRAGFLTPIAPSQNVTGIVFPPIEEEPLAYKLWDSGTGDRQYFLVERREPIGFDDGLPGGGLLIYHVDEDMLNNDDAVHYKVALEQADGQLELENRMNAGDTGDPYPGSANSTTFGYETAPNSISYSGGDSKVRVFNIQESGADLVADIWVQAAPRLSVTGISIADADGDGNPDPGEEVSLNITLKNGGATAPGVTGYLVPRSSCIAVEQSTASFGTIAPDSERAAQTPFTFTVSDTLTQDPFGAWFDLTFSSTNGYVKVDSMLLAVGDVVGLTEDMEAPVGWEHSPARGGWLDEWRLTTHRAYEGSQSWVCSRVQSGTYSPRNDAALVTPLALVGSEAKLVFYYWIDAHADTSGADDGGFVEVSVNGAPWQQVTPVGGYPWALKGQREPWIEGRRVFSGTTSEWQRTEFSLNGFANSALRVRFRFISNEEWTVGEGWYVDSVTVVSSGVPVLVSSLRAVEKEGCVDLLWVADRELKNAPFSVWREPGPEGAAGMQLLTVEPIFREGSYDFRDCDVVTGQEYRYWVGIENSPGLFCGPVSIVVSGGGAISPRLELASNNPVRDVLRLVLYSPSRVDASRVTLNVFDISGRHVKTLTPGLIAGAGSQSALVEWDTSDNSGNSVGPGVYFLRLDWPGGSKVEKVVVLKGARGF